MKKGDRIVLISVIILTIISAAGVFIYKYKISGSDKIAVIKQNGKIIKTINLNSIRTPEEFTIKYERSHFNKIRVEKGRISVVDADCPDKICVKTGWISNPGQSSVCLPHKLIVEIEGSNSQVDTIVR